MISLKKFARMKWTGTEKQKETITSDGYHLIVKRVNETKYSWAVSYNGNVIKKFENKSKFKDTIPRAKRQAIRLMVSHMLNKID